MNVAFTTMQASWSHQNWALKASLNTTNKADRRVAVGEEKGVLAHSLNPIYMQDQKIANSVLAKTHVRNMMWTNMYASTIKSGKKRVLAHPLNPSLLETHRLDRRVVANKLVLPLQRHACLSVAFIVTVNKYSSNSVRLHLSQSDSNRTALLPEGHLILLVTVRPARRGFEMQALVSAGSDITAMGDRPVMRYTPAITGSRLTAVDQPLVSQKHPSRHHPEGATQARGGFTQKSQITSWRFRSVASSRPAMAAPPIELPTNKVPNWSCTITNRAAKSCQPNGFSDIQYGMLVTSSEAKLMIVDRVANKAAVFAGLLATIYSVSANRILAISWVYTKPVNKTPTPLTADSHSQSAKKLSMVEFPYLSRFLRITHRSRSAAVTARKEVSNKFYLGNSTTPNFELARFVGDYAYQLRVDVIGLQNSLNLSNRKLLVKLNNEGSPMISSLTKTSYNKEGAL